MRKLTTKQFIEKAIKNHGDKYRYDKVFYINNRTKVQIYCKKCKKYFLQIPNSHLNGKGCSACFNWNRTTTDFIKESKLINGDKYGYDKSTYINSRTKVEIYCKYHKTYFKQTPHAHLSGQGCPICSESKGEKEIRIFLEKYNIQHVIQKRFDDCKNKRALPFDVYLPDYNICIEYQGQQHYQLIEYIGKKILNIEESKKLFKKQQKRDKIKRDYCKINNIPLLEIPYWNMKNIDTILTAFINTCN